MQKIFIKIFLWFWLAMTLIGAILVVLALTTDPVKTERARHTKKLMPYVKELILSYEQGGPDKLLAEIQKLETKMHARLFLFHGQEGPLCKRSMPRPFYSLLRNGDDDDTANGRMPMRGHHMGRAKRRHLFVVPLADDYRLLAGMPPPTPLEHLLNPHALTMRLIVTFLVAGIVCYLLARSLTAPITKLRQATQEIADGNFSTRVMPLLGGRRDELGDLAEDFDQMTEKLETSIQSQQRLLRDISHELRSPLARLNVALELARQRATPETNQPLNRIEKEAERLNELIGQLLTLNQLENRSELPETEKIDLRLFLENIVKDANYEAQNTSRRVSLAVNRFAVITGSQELLRRAIENVIRNGLRYTADNSQVEVTLDTFENQGLARITVRDHGPGVPEKVLDDLFRPFYRVADARDRQSGGVGVGLAIAERSIRLHGGEIKASNAADNGLVISITLPLSNES